MLKASLPNEEPLITAVTSHDKTYWANKLQDLMPLQLPTSHVGVKGQNMADANVTFTIDNDLKEQILQLSGQYHIPPSMTALAVFQILLYRYSNQGGICTAAVMNNRLLPVCVTELNGELTFTEFLEKLIISIKESNDHIESFFDEDALLFSSMFVFKDKRGNTDIDPSVHFVFDAELSLVLEMTGSGIQGRLLYSIELYHEETIKKMAKHYVQLLKSVSEGPEQKIGALPMLTNTELLELSRFNHTIAPYAADKTINSLFEEQVLKTPDNLALQLGEDTLTYEDLNERCNCLARHLIENGVIPGDNVGLLVERGVEMIVGMYAILKAGGAYVPVDPNYPIERQEYILSNSAVSMVLADAAYPLNSLMPAIQFIEMNADVLISYDNSNLSLAISSRQLAYTIYTSGSTGRPKGVMIEHHSAVNLVQWVNSSFKVNDKDRLLFITSMCFDLSVYDVFGILAAGGTVVIAQRDQVNDINELQLMLQRYHITFWDSVPTTLDYLIKEMESDHKVYVQNELRIVFLSGDWIPLDLPGRIKNYFPAAHVISLGGATEGTVWSNYFPVDKIEPYWNSIPYGKPIANNFFYILNEQLQPVPIGVAGELYIGGVGVARGYANEPEKTAYSFVPDPFNADAGGIMYRTGDLGKMLPDMNMEFLGRRDTQVKIRGFRVELGEIESVLNQCGLVSSAVVLAMDDKEGKKRLLGYIVANGTFDKAGIIRHIKSKLPDYMVPAMWMELKSMPLNVNGKIDRKALPDINLSEQLVNRYAAPLSNEEKIMTELWQQVLGIEKIGVNDNFFELGGHSLMALQLIYRLEKKTGKKLPIATFFKYPTIYSLLANIKKDFKKPHEYLIPIKASGNKMPLYIIHGEGLHILNLSELAQCVDAEQPLFGLETKDMGSLEKSCTGVVAIAEHYISGIAAHNHTGAFAIAGYSFSGFVAVEMEKQLKAMGKEVKMLPIFDTRTENPVYNKAWYTNLPKKVKQQLPKFVWIVNPVNEESPAEFHFQFEDLSKTLRQLAYNIESSQAGPVNPIDLLKPGTGTPLFLFPGWHGYPVSFNDFLNTYNGNQPLYSIYYPEDSENFPFNNLGEYAKYVITQMKLLCPSGPYSLLGYSMGGTIIYEIAVQLQQAGDKVDLLAIVSICPHEPIKGSIFMHKISKDINTLIKVPSYLKLKYVQHRIPHLLKTAINKIFPSLYLRVKDPDAPDYVHKQISLIADKYKTTSTFDGDIVLIREKEISQSKYIGYWGIDLYRHYNMSNLWKKYIKGNIKTQILTCHHSEFFVEPSVKHITEIVQSHQKQHS